jgi:hypothetical protein
MQGASVVTAIMLLCMQLWGRSLWVKEVGRGLSICSGVTVTKALFPGYLSPRKLVSALPNGSVVHVAHDILSRRNLLTSLYRNAHLLTSWTLFLFPEFCKWSNSFYFSLYFGQRELLGQTGSPCNKTSRNEFCGSVYPSFIFFLPLLSLILLSSITDFVHYLQSFFEDGGYAYIIWTPSCCTGVWGSRIRIANFRPAWPT